MVIFPIDPTPYFLPYAVTVFLFPWLVYMLFTFKYFDKMINLVFRGRVWEAMKEPLSRSHKKWLFITISCWTLGFILLLVVLLYLDMNNLLVNHSKGIY